MEGYFRQQGYDPGNARQRAQMEEEDAWRRRERAAAQSQAPRPAARPESRTSGASLPLPADREVPFGSPASSQGMPPVEPGLDPARVAEVAATMPGIPPEEAWQRAQLALMRGPGRGGASASAPRPRVNDPWAGRPVSEGLNPDKVRSLATYYVQEMRMKPEDAWAKAQVEVSRGVREGTTSTSAELDSRLRGGQGSERMYPNSTVPGVNDASGVPTRVSREMSDAEAAAYNARSLPREGGVATEGAYEYSQRDKDMMDRGFVPVQTPAGVQYMPSGAQLGEIPGRPGFPGKGRPDLEERGYTVEGRKDVAGRDLPVYVRTPEGAARANNTRPADWGGAQGGTPFAVNQRIKYLAEQAGVSVEEARRIVDAHVEQSAGQILPGSQAAFQPLRDMAATRSQGDKLSRIQRVRQNAMLAGGQPTGGPGGTIAYTNALSMMPQDWQNQVLANRLTGGDITGSTPLDVQGQQIRNGNRLLTADALAGNTEAAAAIRTLEMNEAIRRQTRQDALRQKAAVAWHGQWKDGSRSGEARRALEEAGATPEEIDAILDDLGAGSIPAPQALPAPPIPGLDPSAIRPQPGPLMPPPAPTAQPPWSPGRMPNW
jgi:hypothetical protein